jgi:hypothetical protein
MAKAALTSNIAANRVQVLFSTDQEHFEGTVNFTPAHTRKSIMSQRTGMIPIAKLGLGSTITGTLTLREGTFERLRAHLHQTAGVALAVGTLVPTIPIRIHDIAAGSDTDDDIVIPKADLTIGEIVNSGEGEREIPIAFEGIYDAAIGAAWCFGDGVPE